MMSIGLTEELSQDTETKAVIYFFCQNADQELNTIQAVIKGLISRLITRQSTLIHALRRRWSTQENNFTEDLSRWQALWDIFLEMLDEYQHTGATVFIVVDALDECREEALASFLREVVRTGLDRPKRIKWLLTSRPLGSMEYDLMAGAKRVHVSLEINAGCVDDGIQNFVSSQVDKLAQKHGYDAPTKQAVREAIRVRANGTFLWASIVCKRLEDISVHEAVTKVNETPPELERLYDQAYANLDGDLQSNGLRPRYLLCVLMLAFRPLSLPETMSLNILPDDAAGREATIDQCSTFIRLRHKNGVQYFEFVHQSVRDFLSAHSDHNTETPLDHKEMARMCLTSLMNHLPTDVVQRPMASATREAVGERFRELLRRGRSPNMGIDYAARFWIDHLHTAAEISYSSVTTVENGDVEVFLLCYFLQWIEQLSLSDESLYAFTGLTTLRTMLVKLQVSPWSLLSSSPNHQ